MLVIRPANPDDLPGALEVLDAAGRPCLGVSENWEHYVVLADRRAAAIHGLSGFEVHGTAGVIRSVVVARSARGRGYGRRLVEEVASSASWAGVSDLFLVTCHATQFYRRVGFRSVLRSNCPSEIGRSPSFRFTLSTDATVMYRAVVRPPTRISHAR
jgi:N-acetylglutamate synthase-like GNAT family acetyltransferase